MQSQRPFLKEMSEAQGKIKQLIEIFEDTGKIVKTSALISTGFGAYYLLVYTAKLGIPFPLELSVLPTALLAIGAISIFFTLLIVFNFLLASFVNADPFGIDYPVLINTNRKGVIGSSFRVNLWNWFLIYGFPIGFFLILSFYKALPKSNFGISVLFGMYFLWSILYGLVKIQIKKKIKITELSKADLRSSFKIGTTLFLLAWLGILSSTFFLAVMFYQGIVTKPEHLFIVIPVFILLNYCALTPRIRLDYLEFFTTDNMKINSELKKKAFTSPILIVFILCFILTSVPNIASYIGELPLKLLNIGGGN